ncbi:MAG: GSCFA domain-containing protein [Roseivirga sp.]|nr:GSCFA domain-containing protein [Roseivirga sp.]
MSTSILSMGSCFASDIGQQLIDHKFPVTINPGGILFNPLSLFELLEMSVKDSQPAGITYLEHDGVFLNHQFHSDVNASSRPTLEEQISGVKTDVREGLKHANLVILTFGTAWVYRLKADNSLVANCHKVPQSSFNKELLTVEKIVQHFTSFKELIQELNPTVKFLLTVSPVRHIKDTIPLNSVSKSVLRLACHQIRENFAETDYFPSYELMMDDLRGYRFYKKDMIHPNEQAIDYIWQKFVATFLSDTTRTFVGDWTKIRSAMQHKPFHPASAAHQKFLKNLILKVQNLSGQADVSKELGMLKAQLI